MNIPFSVRPGQSPLRVNLIPDHKNTKFFSISKQKKPPCTLGGKNVFFQGSTNGNGFKKGLDYQLLFKDLESGLVGY
jgi:hypothetical protein